MRKLFSCFSSIRLTIALLVFSMALVFFGTLDQVHFGIHETQKRYFESFYVLWQYPLQWPYGAFLNNKLALLLPGGYLLGSILFLNLICAHFKHFTLHWKKVGITLIHSGILILIASAFFTSFWQEEFQMWLHEGKTSSYLEDMRDNELVIIDKTDSQWDNVWAIPQSLLKAGETFALEDFPLTVNTKAFYPNALIGLGAQNPEAEKGLATKGAGARMDMIVVPQTKTYKDDEVNRVTAYVNITAKDQDLGTWLVSNVIDDRQFPPQTFTYEGRHYEIALRFKRNYLPFELKLINFTHDRYPGTQIPKNFSSRVAIVHPDDKAQDRQTLIYMNHPLRYAGYTFYQASFAEQDTASMLQVVKNPSRLMPYIAVLCVAIGLLAHFILHLVHYLIRNET